MHQNHQIFINWKQNNSPKSEFFLEDQGGCTKISRFSSTEGELFAMPPRACTSTREGAKSRKVGQDIEKWGGIRFEDNT